MSTASEAANAHNQGGAATEKYHTSEDQHDALVREVSSTEAGIILPADATRLEEVTAPSASADAGKTYQRAKSGAYSYIRSPAGWYRFVMDLF
jgi:hypothetical protein